VGKKLKKSNIKKKELKINSVILEPPKLSPSEKTGGPSSRKHILTVGAKSPKTHRSGKRWRAKYQGKGGEKIRAIFVKKKESRKRNELQLVRTSGFGCGRRHHSLPKRKGKGPIVCVGGGQPALQKYDRGAPQ